MLTLLAVNTGTVVRTDQIIEELWEERPPPSAVTTLQTYVCQLRKLFNLSTESGTPCVGATGPGHDGMLALRTSRMGYMLALPPAALDCHEFEQLAELGRAQLDAGRHEEAVDTLRTSLQLWRGPVFSDTGVGPVLQITAVRLEEVRKSVLEQRIEAEMALGRHYELISELTSLVAQQPTHEGFHAKLMLVLYRAGRRLDALQVYQRARTALASELGLEPSVELQRLHHAMLVADADLDGPSGPPVQVRLERAAPPSHLPPDITPLVGLDQASTQLQRILLVSSQSAPKVVLVHGKPGSGKSAFCVHAAHTLRAAYPDGQLFIELMDATGARVDTVTALGHCLRAARIPHDHLPISLEERIRLFRSWTSHRRVLVVLDDAVDAGQVISLLPAGAGCAALVACRRRLPGPSNAATVYLAPLCSSGAQAMLIAILGRQRTAGDPAAVRELAQLCEGLPSALHAAASKLLLRPHWSIRHMINWIRLNSQPGVHTSVRRTYQLMAPAVRAAFREAAAQHVHPVTAVTLARALGVDVRDAEELLEELVEFQLADVQIREDEPDGAFRYQVTPLLRACVAHLDEEDEVKDTHSPEIDRQHGELFPAHTVLATSG